MATTIKSDPNDATTTYTQPTPIPTAKVAAAGIGGAVTTLLIWLLSLFGIVVSGEVAAALTTIIAFLAGYIKKSDTANGAVKEV